MVPPNDKSVGGNTSPGIVRVPDGEPIASLARDAARVVLALEAGVCAPTLPPNHEAPNALASAAFAVERNSCRRFM
jgi:hypothetical protein